MESSFLVQCCRGIDSFLHADFAPILVFMECLIALEVYYKIKKICVVYCSDHFKFFYEFIGSNVAYNPWLGFILSLQV